ncbi:MAG: hypothetical protein AWU55_1751 [Halomonadaceae bacterium T82-2]|nr:MAG: hypothetical protein AWU55_1751 [Halomonadaceae bacterium T82-2]
MAGSWPLALEAVVSVCSTDDRYADDVHYMGGACWVTTCPRRPPCLPTTPCRRTLPWSANAGAAGIAILSACPESNSDAAANVVQACVEQLNALLA